MEEKTYKKGGIKYHRDSSGKVTRVKTYGKKSTSKSKSSSTQTSTSGLSAKDEISKKLYGKTYSNLSPGQQRAANFSISNAERQAKKSSGGKSFSQSDIVTQFEKGMTDQSKSMSDKERRESIQRRGTQTQSQTVRNLTERKSQEQTNIPTKTPTETRRTNLPVDQETYGQKLDRAVKEEKYKGKDANIPGLFILSAAKAAKDTWKFGEYLLTTPPEEIGKTIKAVAFPLIMNPKQTWSSFQSAATEFGIKLQTDTVATTVPLVAEIATDLAIGTIATKSVKFVRQVGSDVAVATTSKYVKPTKVFSTQVLDEGKTFPTYSSTQEHVEEFFSANTGGRKVSPHTRTNINLNKGQTGDYIIKTPEYIATEVKVKGYLTKDKFTVSTASPQPISGNIAGAGKSGEFLLQDPGIYTTTKGHGSPYFLGVDQPQSYKLSLIPDTAPTRPTISEFNVQGLGKVPKNVLEVPGFRATADYAEKEFAEKGFVYTSKRSQIGRGEIKRQQFVVEESFKSPFTGEEIPKGTLLWEAGTTEGEHIIPLSSKFIPSDQMGKKVQREFTTYKGRVVGIEKYDVIPPSQMTPEMAAQAQKAAIKESTGRKAYYELSDSSSKPKTIQTSYSFFNKPSSSTVSVHSSSTITAPAGSVSYVLPRPTSYTPTNSYSRTPTSYNTGSSSGGGSSGGGSSGGGSSYGGSSGGGSSYGGSFSTRETSITPAPPAVFHRGTNKQKKTYEVFVKVRGNWVSIGTRNTRKAAVALGKQRVATSAAASFKVVDVSKKESISTFDIGSSFRSSLTTPGVFVEKRHRRIKSSGELRDITYKGITASRLKRGTKNARRG